MLTHTMLLSIISMAVGKLRREKERERESEMSKTRGRLGGRSHGGETPEKRWIRKRNHSRGKVR